MDIKKIISESISKNPTGLKQVFEEVIMERIALALEKKKLDKVDPEQLKGDFEDREDKDINNDGKVDDSDEYLHNRRKVIMKAMKKESVDLDEKVNTGPEEAISIIANSIAMNPPVVKAALEAANLDPVAVVTALKGKKTIKVMQLGNLVMGHAFGGSISKKDLMPIKKAADAAFIGKMKEEVELDEAKKDKPSFGSSDGFSYAVNLNGVDNEFLNQPFGRQLDAMQKVKEFTSKAKKGYAGAKGKSTLAAVKDWVKLNQPTQFYAKWKSDSRFYKNDSVEIFYTKEANESLDEVSSKTLANYINKASDASKHRKLPAKKVDNRYAGVNLASKKLDKKLSGVKESDDLDEAMLDRKKIAKAVKARYDFKSGMDYQQIVPKINQELVRAGMKIFVGDRDVINSILDLID